MSTPTPGPAGAATVNVNRGLPSDFREAAAGTVAGQVTPGFDAVLADAAALSSTIADVAADAAALVTTILALGTVPATTAPPSGTTPTAPPLPTTSPTVPTPTPATGPVVTPTTP